MVERQQLIDEIEDGESQMQEASVHDSGSTADMHVSYTNVLVSFFTFEPSNVVLWKTECVKRASNRQMNIERYTHSTSWKLVKNRLRIPLKHKSA